MRRKDTRFMRHDMLQPHAARVYFDALFSLYLLLSFMPPLLSFPYCAGSRQVKSAYDAVCFILRCATLLMRAFARICFARRATHLRGAIDEAKR